MRGKCFWCQKQGHMAQDCLCKKAGNPRVPPKKHVAIIAYEKQIEEKKDFDFSVVVCQLNVANVIQIYKDENEPCVIDSGHYTNNPDNIHRCHYVSDGAVATEGP